MPAGRPRHGRKRSLGKIDRRNRISTSAQLKNPDPSVAPALNGSFIIPVTVDDLAANGLLGDEYPQTCWERSVETLIARKDEITGLAIASDERFEAYLLYI